MTADRIPQSAGGGKSSRAFRTIGEAARALGLPQHVLRFWETRFPQIRPLKRGGNRRYYRPEDLDLLLAIRTLLHDEGYTIKGVQKRFRERGVKPTVEEVLGSGREVPASPDRAVASGSASSPGLSGLREDLARIRRLLD